LIEAQVVAKAKGGSCIILTASIPLARPLAVSTSRRVSVPPDERKQCEHAIEAAVNHEILVSRQPLTLSSPIPPVAFIPESRPDEQLLAGLVSVDLGETNRNVEWFNQTLDRNVGIDALVDRFDGVSLLLPPLLTNARPGRRMKYCGYLSAPSLAVHRTSSRLSPNF
jgi:hypothetical protein